MSDLDGLPGIYPVSLRWQSEEGVLGYSTFNEATGERDIIPIALGSNEAKFGLDLATRVRGFILIRPGVYETVMTPVGSPLPPPPDNPDFKTGLGCWLWNPPLGELRLETCQATFLRPMGAAWDRCRSFKEAVAGLVPVIHFVDRYQQHYKSVGKSFWAPVIHIVGWLERDQTPFALREATVPLPVAIDAQVSFAQLEAHQTPVQKKLAEKLQGKAPPRSQPPTIGDFIDDEIPTFDPPVDETPPFGLDDFVKQLGDMKKADFDARLAAEEQRLGKDRVAAVKKAHRNGRYRQDWVSILAALAGM